MTVAEYIADQLLKNGVRYVFGIPGGPSIPYLEAFRKAEIEFILTSNEAAAGIMADVTARLTGITGVCHATYGPGATNITTGIGGAFLDRSPVIVFTSEMSDVMIHRTTQMNIDHQKLFVPITKATMRLSPGNAVTVLDKAFRISREEYPGPVHIGLPAGIADLEIEPGQIPADSAETKIPDNNTDEIVGKLRNARRPLMAVGLTSARYSVGKQLAAFLEKYKMPVIITPMAKGILPEDHPCYAGVLFHALSDFLEDIYNQADLIIGLGYDPVEFNYESWMPDVPLLHFDTKITDMPSSIRPIQFAGPPDQWFRVLENLNAGFLTFNSKMTESLRDELEAVFAGFSGHFGPVTAMKILHQELPENAIVTTDVGSHLHLAGQYWKCKGDKKIIMTNGWSGMGFGLPAALAAQLANPGTTVACLTGDGGFLMMAGEIITARRYRLPVITVVFSDGELNLIRLKQTWLDLTPYATALYAGDLFGSEKFFGVKVLTADSEESMIKAVKHSLSLNEPVIINAIIDPDDYKWLVVRQKS
ncbi:MAG: thiamine pyrophosphate-binding protein [Bacteroidota bacterium]|nr:thiamine pyrophosphate-binding protein [Bacteroidota bacterium]